MLKKVGQSLLVEKRSELRNTQRNNKDTIIQQYTDCTDTNIYVVTSHLNNLNYLQMYHCISDHTVKVINAFGATKYSNQLQ